MAMQTQQPPQPLPATTNQIYQPAMVTVQTQPSVNDPNQLRIKNIIKGLAIAELVLGSICVALGMILTPFGFNGRFGNPTVGEGIWCGVWIIVAGSLGMQAAKLYSSRCMINCHMAFSIVGAVFSGLLFSLGVLWTIINYSVWRVILFSLIDICSFTSMILLIISASYCCGLNGCCNQTPAYYPGQGGQVMYVPSAVSLQPSTNMQVFQTTMPGVQSGYVQQPAINQIIQEPNPQNLQKEQEDFANQGHVNPAANVPPPY